MKSICLSCIIYTLKDKDVNNNQYLNLFFIWIGKVIHAGGLTKEDMINITIDNRTYSHLLENYSPFSQMLEEKKVPCKVQFTIVESPETHLHGMMNKYLLIDFSQDIFIYCDIDILIMNPFHTLTEHLTEEKIYISSEGKLESHDYSSGFSNHISEDKLEEMVKDKPGFSAGVFAIVGKALCHTFFNTINGFCNYSTEYHCIEQPFFNMAIYLTKSELHPFEYNLLKPYVSFNGDEYNKQYTIFFHSSGIPGDSGVHIIKTINYLSLFLAGII